MYLLYKTEPWKYISENLILKSKDLRSLYRHAQRSNEIREAKKIREATRLEIL